MATEQSHHEALCDALESIVKGVGQRMDRYQDIPVKGSIAARELAAISEPAEALKTAYSQGTQGLIAAGDHCFALERVLRPTAQSHALWTLARGVLEGASVAKWLLDPSLDLDTRLARSMSRRLYSLSERRKFENERLGRKPEAAHLLVRVCAFLDERVEQVIAQGKQLGIREKRDSRDRLIGFGEGLLSKVDLVRFTFGDAATYRALSGAAHGEPWATLNMSFRRVAEKPAATQDLDPEAVAAIIVKCSSWFGRAVWDYFELNGWDLRELEEFFETQYRGAAIPTGSWFWRTEAK